MKKTWELMCQVCLHEYDVAHQKVLGVCPFCGTKLEPMVNAQAGYIRIHWQQLRVLAIYAQRWTMHFDTGKRGNRDAVQALKNIINHLSQFRPRGAEPIVPPEEVQVQTTLAKTADAPENLEREPDGSVKSPYFEKGA